MVLVALKITAHNWNVCQKKIKFESEEMKEYKSISFESTVDPDNLWPVYYLSNGTNNGVRTVHI